MVPHMTGKDTPLGGARMRSRAEGMWWGTAIEAPDPGALARSYSALRPGTGRWGTCPMR
jgi:hypothetical protein